MSRIRSSLRARHTVVGVAIFTVLVVALDTFLYLSMRDRLLSNLDKVLEARAQTAAAFGAEFPPEALDERLRDAGVRAIVRRPEGTIVREEEVTVELDAMQGGERFDTFPPGDEHESVQAARTVQLDDGGEVTVLASRGGIDATLSRILQLQVVGSAVAIAVAAVVLSRSSRLVLRPVNEVSRTAARIADGRTGERIETRPRDVELQRMVGAFNDMVDALEGALGEARASDEASRRFLADAAHQIRTPIAGIRASVAALMRTTDERDRERLLDNLAVEAQRTSRLLGALLRVARLDQHQETNLQPTNLLDITRSEIDRRRQLSTSVTYSLNAPDGDSAQLLGNPEALEEAISNLLDNAARHAERAVRVDLTVAGSDIVVAVHDDGPGVPPHLRERIFERFVSLDGDGSGLGLPIARGIADNHGGTLEFRDGAFVLRLPIDPQTSGPEDRLSVTRTT